MLCPPNVTKYCMSGYESHIETINYTYSRCENNGFPSFLTHDDNYCSEIEYNNNQWIMGEHLLGCDLVLRNMDIYIVATCLDAKLSNCNQNWIFADNSINATTIYFGSDCAYANHYGVSLYNNYNCQKKIQSASSVSIHVAYDTDSLSGTYDGKCYNSQLNQTYFKKRNLKNQAEKKVVLFYYENNWYISESINDTLLRSNSSTICITQQRFGDYLHNGTIYDAPCFPTEMEPILFANHTKIIHYKLFEAYYISFCLLFGGLLLKPCCEYNGMCEEEDEDENQDEHEEEKAMIEMYHPQKTNIISTTEIIQHAAHDQTDNVSENGDIEDICLQLKHIASAVAKFIFHFIFKTGLEFYDYYSDISVGYQWWVGFYFLQNETKCQITFTDHAISMWVLSSIGFLMGIFGHFLSVKALYFSNKHFSYQSLTNLKHGADYVQCLQMTELLRVFLEDIPSMILCLIVASMQSVSQPSTDWYLAYYSSCLDLAYCTLSLVQRQVKFKCVGCEDGKPKMFCLIGTLIVASFLFPLWGYYHNEFIFAISDNSIISSETARIGFVIDNDECHIMSINDVGLDMEIADGYWLGCHWAEIMQQNYVMRCWVHNTSSVDIKSYHVTLDDVFGTGDKYDIRTHWRSNISCGFWIALNECRNIDCQPFKENMTACLGVMNSQAMYD
eukprot:35390_1